MKPSKPAMTWAAGGGVAAAALVTQTSLVTAGGDGRVLLWDTRRGGRPVGSAASPDGRWGHAGACTLWLVADGEHVIRWNPLQDLTGASGGCLSRALSCSCCCHVGTVRCGTSQACAGFPQRLGGPGSHRAGRSAACWAAAVGTVADFLIRRLC